MDCPNFYTSEAVQGSGFVFTDPLGNLHEELVGFPLHSRVCVIGRSGSGKTNWLMWYLQRCCAPRVSIFDKIFISYSVQEPLYDFLASDQGIGKDNCVLIKGVKDMPSVHDFPSAQTYNQKEKVKVGSRTVEKKVPIKRYCVVFDDVVTAGKVKPADMDKVSDYFRQGRKHNCTVILLSQMYSAVPKFFRTNSNLLVLASLQGRDKGYVLREAMSDFTSEHLGNMYEYCSTPRTRDEKPVMLVNLGHVVDKRRVIRRGFDEWLDPDNFKPVSETRGKRGVKQEENDEEA